MAETNYKTTGALETMNIAVLNAQSEIIATNQGIKAQAYTYQKLVKQYQRYAETFNTDKHQISVLESEIQQAEKQVESLIAAIKAVKLGNIDMNKEFLLIKERKAEIFERITIGQDKYENIRLKSKERYERIPIIRQLTEVKNNNEAIQNNINNLDNECKNIANRIQIKKYELVCIDKGRILKLAEFLVNERPTTLEKIAEMVIKVKEGSKLVEKALKQQHKIKSYIKLNNEQLLQNDHLKTVKARTNDLPFEDNWFNQGKNVDNDDILLPKLHLQNADLDMISVKLDQIKKDLHKTNSGSTLLSGLQENVQTLNKKQNIIEQDVSLYFNLTTFNRDPQYKQKLDRKLIHILEDIKLNKNDAYTLFKTLKPIQVQETKYDTLKPTDPIDQNCNSQEMLNKTIQIEEINKNNLSEICEEYVYPPSQFLDVAQNAQHKKLVTFNISNENERETSLGDGTKVDEIAKSQEDNLSTISNESYTSIKQYEYVTSNFFENKISTQSEKDEAENNINREMETDQIVKSSENVLSSGSQANCSHNMDINKSKFSLKGEMRSEVPVDGLLFKYGPRGIPESLDGSIPTAGFGDGEDYPHCIDSSLLLSPKADIPVTGSGENEVISPERPNFLTTFRRTGLSFLGTSDSKPDSSAQDQSSAFNFTFGRDEKKGRGGLFSMFR